MARHKVAAATTAGRDVLAVRARRLVEAFPWLRTYEALLEQIEAGSAVVVPASWIPRPLRPAGVAPHEPMRVEADGEIVSGRAITVHKSQDTDGSDR